MNGELHARYIYDAWGNHTVVNDTETEIGTINPIRYRSYYYDTETNFYYLRARYYDPETGRFISQDNISYLNSENLTGLNLYAYCSNDPVTGYDPIGTWDWGSFWRGVGYAVTGVAAVVTGALVIASGVALAPMVAVAAVTIAAGALTTINGAAEIIEAGTGTNFVEDVVFQGNSTAYDIYSTVTGTVATVGTAICGGWLKINQPRIQAYKGIETYNRSQTVIGHTERAYNDSILLQKDVIKYGEMTKDTMTKTGYVFKASGSFNGSPKFWRLVVSNAKKIIWHFGFGF